MALAAGCLQKETVHTLYISPDDQVTWVAVEADVRSDGEDPVERYGEERDYLAAAAEGRHPIAKALAALAPDAVVRTQLLRDERPFRVQTDAAVGPADRVLQRLFDAAGVRAVVRLTRDAGRTTLVVQFDLSAPNPGTNHPVSVLMEDFESFRLVLTDGRYISGNGWDISNDVALLSKEWLERAEEAPRDGRRIELTLSWEAR
jgi:hypothetical protein